VLAVHGIAGNSLTWAPIARRLPEFDLIAPDVRGRAHSRSVAGGYGLARHADDLVLVLDELGVAEPVALVGHSMGAFIACVAAVRHPDRFARLVLVDGGHDFGVFGPDDDLDDVLNRVLALASPGWRWSSSPPTPTTSSGASIRRSPRSGAPRRMSTPWPTSTAT